MRVHIWTADTAGSGWYRGHLTALALAWLGHRSSAGMRLPGDPLDTVIGCRIALPGPSKVWRELKDKGVRLVLDLDDDYFHLDPANARAVQVWSGEMQRSLAANLALADVVTCCSEPLAAVLREYAADVRVVPNGLPAQYLGTPRDYLAADRPLYVGWAGSGSTVAELPMAARALNRIAQYRRPDGGEVRVRLVGITPEQAMARGLRGRQVGALGWVPHPEQYLRDVVSEFDVWCAPYRDIPFNRAKFPTKWLESSMLGIPLIASDIEPYRRVIRHGETGFLVRHEHEFGRYLKRLADDPGLRQRIGMAARAEASGSILQATQFEWDAVVRKPAEVTA
jgi:glycosyltransferase involved in cell wall biosynthesis